VDWSRAALFVYYQQRPPTPGEAALFAKDTDSVFPVWITTVIPPGLSGLILAGAFAAAISSLDSALAAFLLALSPLRRDIRGIIIGTAISILLVLWARPDLYNILAALGAITTEEAAAWRPKINLHGFIRSRVCSRSRAVSCSAGKHRPRG